MTDPSSSRGEDALREYETIAVRVLTREDLDAVVRLDKRITGHSRRDYYALKIEEALRDTRIVVSLGAEVDGHLAGFLMGRLYYGEFGVADPVAILDTIGVDPERPRAGIGHALLDQFRTNLRALGIERIQTHAPWNQWDLLHFLDSCGFKPGARVFLEAGV